MYILKTKRQLGEDALSLSLSILTIKKNEYGEIKSEVLSLIQKTTQAGREILTWNAIWQQQTRESPPSPNQKGLFGHPGTA